MLQPRAWHAVQMNDRQATGVAQLRISQPPSVAKPEHVRHRLLANRRVGDNAAIERRHRGSSFALRTVRRAVSNDLIRAGQAAPSQLVVWSRPRATYGPVRHARRQLPWG